MAENCVDCNKFYKPSFIVQNISNKAVRVLNSATIPPGATCDLYSVFEPNEELFEDLIHKHLERPWGDLYVEVEIKKTLKIVHCDLVSWHYSIVTPCNISSSNTFFPGAVPAAVDEDTFVWVDPSSGLAAEAPLVISGGVISIPPAGSGVDGYLTAEDWARFDASVKPDMKIWQYQDFAAPAGSSVTLSAFENGTMTFNSSYILDGTAVVTLTSDPSSPPTTTNSIPAKYLPGNRVNVSSHIGTTVTFDNTVESTQNVRVYYLIRLPAEVKLPADYQEDPEFLNDSSLDFIDENYVNQNQDESVYGDKTFEDALVANDTFQFTTGAVDGYYLRSDSAGNASWAPVTTGGIPVSPTPPGSPDPGDQWIDSDGYELYIYDSVRGKWLSPRTVNTTAARNKNKATNIYLYTADGTTTFIAPFVLPFDATLIAMSASGAAAQTWTAEAHIGGSLVAGASLSVTASTTATTDTLNIDFSSGDAVQIFMSGTTIQHPRVNLVFARRGA